MTLSSLVCVGGGTWLPWHPCSGPRTISGVSPCLPPCMWQGLLFVKVYSRLGGWWATEDYCWSPSARAVWGQTRITASAVHGAGDLDAGLPPALPMEPSSQPSYYYFWKQQSALRPRFSCPHLPSAGVAGVWCHTWSLCSRGHAAALCLPEAEQ